MVDISPTLRGASNRLNADDISSEGRIIVISDVALAGDDGRILVIHYEGENGKPFYPCLTMRRVLSHMWGDEGDNYKGRKLLIYRDPNVKFGDAMVGGIRIKGASNIDKPVTCNMVIGRGKRGKVVINPLKNEGSRPSQQKATNNEAQTESNLDNELDNPEARARKMADNIEDKIASCLTIEDLEKLTSTPGYRNFISRAREKFPDIAKEVIEFSHKAAIALGS